jgi:hypothetical protein
MQQTTGGRQHAADDGRQTTCSGRRAVANGSVSGGGMRAGCGAPRGTDLFLLLGRRLLRRTNDTSARAGARTCVAPTGKEGNRPVDS